MELPVYFFMKYKIFATSLRYDKSKMEAPEISSKSVGEEAELMRRMAKRYGIPIVKNVSLLEQLGEQSVGEEISQELYSDVAQILRGVRNSKSS